jgi:hypothetical protein
MGCEKGNSPVQMETQQYENDGVLVARGELSDVSAKLGQGWDDLKAAIEAGSVQRSARFLSGALPQFIAQLWRHEKLVRRVQELLRTDNIALYMNRVLLKDQKWSGAVSIHQDMPYFHGGMEKVSVFVPLMPLTVTDHGGLVFVQGSHKYGNLQRGTIKRELFEPMNDIAPDLALGDVVYMNFLTWHYSGDAAIPSDRPLIQLTYQPANDGSYFGEPTLVSGQWLTSHFTPLGQTTTPDAGY